MRDAHLPGDRTTTRATTAALLVTLALPAKAEQLGIVALGDMLHGEPEEVDPTFEALIATADGRAPDPMLHTGETKSGSTPARTRSSPGGPVSTASRRL